MVNIVTGVLSLLAALASGTRTAILGLIFIPIILIIQAAVIRVSAELIMSVLLIPSLLAKNQSRDIVAGEIGMEDLHAYGISATDRTTSSAV